MILLQFSYNTFHPSLFICFKGFSFKRLGSRESVNTFGIRMMKNFGRQNASDVDRRASLGRFLSRSSRDCSMYQKYNANQCKQNGNTARRVNR